MKVLSRKTKYIVTVTLNNPNIVKKQMVADYLKEAITSWYGGYHVNHPMWGNIKKVTVK